MFTPPSPLPLTAPDMAADSSGAAPACLQGKGPGERAAILHQHLGRRELTDVIIETIRPRAGMGRGCVGGARCWQEPAAARGVLPGGVWYLEKGFQGVGWVLGGFKGRSARS